MKKTFCDMCGEEITKKNESNKACQIERLIKRHPVGLCKLTIDVIFDNILVNSNPGDVCKYCLLDGILALDDRPKPMDKPI